MVAYRRNFIPGGSYFFTVTLLNRRSQLLTDRIDDIRAAFRSVRKERPFVIEAIEVLPGHLHCIWTLPPGDLDYAMRWREIKSHFSRSIPAGEPRTKGRIHKAERGVWQRRYWEHTLGDDQDWERHINYIHYHPVKHGYVKHTADWPYASFHRFVRRGIYSSDWGIADELCSGEFGE